MAIDRIEIIRASGAIIEKDFDAALTSLPNEPDEALNQLKLFLQKQVEELLHHDLEKLKWVLYRVDVDEQKLKQVLSETPPGDMPGLIADMILQRQLQKAETRIKYSRGEL